MTVATHRRIQLSASLQSLIDSRLDTIDRMLLERVGRGERLAIVREVESQIGELLDERETDELNREDVLAVLGRLDPPEAYLPEGAEDEGRVEVRAAASHIPIGKGKGGREGVARASGLLGVGALCSLILVVLSYFVSVAFQSEVPVYLAFALSIPCTFVCGMLAIALGLYARKSGAWSLVGVITGISALLFWSMAMFVLLMELWG